MSMLLLVQSADDVRSAVKAAGEFLVYRRQRIAAPRETDEVLGIWLRRELDAGLPTWPSFDDRELGASVPVDSQAGELACGPRAGEAAVGIRESFSLSGIWTLCWMDGTRLREARSSAERRCKILDLFLSKASSSKSSTGSKMFFPVFAAEASASIEATMRQLQNDYPQLIGGTWFIDDRERGIVPAGKLDA